MHNLVLIVEGHGDVNAFPNLVGKVGAWLGEQLFIKSPIRSKGWGSVRKPGGLEKWVGLAASREGCKRVVVVVDLDDGCPVVERQIVADRVNELQNVYNISIEICFCMREFEAWFLRCLDMFPGNIIQDDKSIIEQLIKKANHYRDAKGKLRSVMREGYSETGDQSGLIKNIICSELYKRDRSFKKFVKAVSGIPYELLDAA